MGVVDRLYQYRVTEKEIRDWLQTRGYYGSTAKFTELELHALKRPGWVQVFRFTVEVKTKAGEWTVLHGATRSDQRASNDFAVFENPIKQRLQLARWSDGMITRKVRSGPEPAPHTWKDLVVFTGILTVVMLALAFALQN